MQGKHAIYAGLAAGILFAVALFTIDPANAGPNDLTISPCPTAGCPKEITTIKGDGTVSPRPLSAIVVTSCSMAVALYIQLDATHLLRADPRQSDMFTAVNGEQRQDNAGPMKWADAYKLAQSAVLTSHVVIPCTDGTQA